MVRQAHLAGELASGTPEGDFAFDRSLGQFGMDRTQIEPCELPRRLYERLEEEGVGSSESGVNTAEILCVLAPQRDRKFSQRREVAKNTTNKLIQ